ARAERPSTVGFVWSTPLSIVTSATGPARVCAGLSLNSVSGTRVFPQKRGAHAHADAECGQAVADVGPLAEPVGELRHQPDAGGSERVAAGDRPAVRIQP